MAANITSPNFNKQLLTLQKKKEAQDKDNIYGDLP